MTDQNSKPAAMQPIRGEALFTVHKKGPVLEMLIHGKPIASAQMMIGDEYNQLFDHVKASILALAKRSGSPGVSVSTKGPSTRNVAAIPLPCRLRELLRALAVLDDPCRGRGREERQRRTAWGASASLPAAALKFRCLLLT